MAPTGNVPQLPSSGKSHLSRTGVLTIHGFGVRVRMQSGHLEIEDGVGPERRKIRLARVGHGLRRLVMIGSDGFATFEALRWLADQDAAFVMLDRNGKVLVTTGPVAPSDVRLRRSQAVAHQSGIALKIARELIIQKLHGQEQVIRKFFGESQALHVLADAWRAVGQAKTNEEIRSWEARGALAYWSTMREMSVNFSKSDSLRIPEHWKRFGSRVSPLTDSPRHAVSPANAILNYLYAILESESRLALAALGLDPGIGVLHNDLRSRDSLASDLMEPVRPKVDALLLNLLRSEQFRRDWFFEQRDGNCRLMASFAATLSETAMMWRREVASFAEWIVKCFWDSRVRPTRSDAPATRLTQRQRSDGRTRLLAVDLGNDPLRPVLCRTCGQIRMSRDGICRNCAEPLKAGTKLSSNVHN
jgi:CRISPR-associated endonuclease Cas1